VHVDGEASAFFLGDKRQAAFAKNYLNTFAVCGKNNSN
jgi:hypothetical protein